MPRGLSPDQIAHYRREGFVFPVDVLDAGEVAERRADLEAFEARHGGKLPPTERSKAHLVFGWIDALIHDPRVIDPIEALIGPDILCWNTIFWIKEAGSPTFVSWHQDIKYWGLAGGEVVTAWLALSPASAESGCMRVLPSTHEGELMAHEDRYDAANLLTRGQEIAVEVDEARAVSMALEPGQMSLHNVQLAHASGPNRSKDRRIGLSMHFMPTAARQTLADWDSATLVRGEDRHGNFQLAPRPGAAPADEVRAFHARATAALRDILYKDAHHQTGKL
jgi:hypothetical protein